MKYNLCGVNQKAIVDNGWEKLSMVHMAVLDVVTDLFGWDELERLPDPKGEFYHIELPRIVFQAPMLKISEDRCRQIIKDLADTGLLERYRGNQSLKKTFIRKGANYFKLTSERDKAFAKKKDLENRDAKKLPSQLVDNQSNNEIPHQEGIIPDAKILPSQLIDNELIIETGIFGSTFLDSVNSALDKNAKNIPVSNVQNDPQTPISDANILSTQDAKILASINIYNTVLSTNTEIQNTGIQNTESACVTTNAHAHTEIFSGEKEQPAEPPKRAIKVKPKEPTQEEPPQELSTADKGWVAFQTFLKEYAPAVLKMKRPITRAQFDQLMIDFPKGERRDALKKTLQEMDNKEKLLLKDYSNADFTLRSWVERNLPKNGIVRQMNKAVDISGGFNVGNQDYSKMRF